MGEDARKLRIGVAGLGRGFTVMLPTFARDPRVTLVAAADPRPEARARFVADFAGTAHESVAALCEHLPELAAEVKATEREIDRSGVEIEHECLRILALYEPVACKRTIRPF